MSQLITTGDDDEPKPIEGVRQPLKFHSESQVRREQSADWVRKGNAPNDLKISSSRNCCSTPRNRRVRQRKAVSNTPCHLSRQRIQQTLRRCREHRHKF